MKKGWDIAFFVYIQLWITKDLHSQEPLCPDNFKDLTLKVCTDHLRSRTGDVFIDTAGVPKFQQTFCECIITPCQPETKLLFTFWNNDENDVQIKINDMVLQKKSHLIETTLSGETTLYFSTAENYTRGACVLLQAKHPELFNITCSRPTHVIDTTPSASSKATKANTRTKDLSGNVNVKTSATETIQKGSITLVTTDASYKGNITLTQNKSNGSHAVKKTKVIVVPAVIGVLLIAAVLIVVYVRRRRFANDTKKHEQDSNMSSSEQGEQNNHENEEGNLDIPVNAYERLNMYANDTIAGEMYQQLNSDKTEENLEMFDAVTDSRNQNRNVTKQEKQESQLKGKAKGQENNSNDEDRDTDIASNAYQRLNMHANDNIAGEMYEQLNPNTNVSGNKDIQVEKSYRGTKQKKQEFVEYENAQ